ncbi:LysR family transcriptional regulator [Azorhizobium oxalatiphilum]|uniref:LysR family transcriptional regulator n=1 Tax=Azorhizobium oxalatiphilum TaxID=980631 RepID=A0A917C405_9HYPH|nr:LysR family transcriptional regulator [Azorhizobium oxalatiphilum]GGF71278.1 LysR family transcriptional regulator [Azorhizobium oxalatiphilum]
MDQVLALRTFVRIVEAGSLVKAAGSLNLPRSTVSKLLQDLEDHLGSRLISRSTRAATITTEGAAYYRYAVRLLSDLDEMDAAVRGSTLKPTGRLRVDVGSSLANLILIPELPGFLARYPEIELSLGVSDRTADLVSEGIDCVIRGGPLTDSALIARTLGQLPYVTCATPGYLDANGTPHDLSDLRTLRSIGYFSAATASTFPLRFRRDGAPDELRLAQSISVNESTAHMTALLTGLGIGQTFEFVARPYLQDGRLREILGPYRPAPHPLHLIYHPSRKQNARVRAFCDWAVGLFARIEQPHTSPPDTSATDVAVERTMQRSTA